MSVYKSLQVKGAQATHKEPARLIQRHSHNMNEHPVSPNDCLMVGPFMNLKQLYPLQDSFLTRDMARLAFGQLVAKVVRERGLTNTVKKKFIKRPCFVYRWSLHGSCFDEAMQRWPELMAQKEAACREREEIKHKQIRLFDKFGEMYNEAKLSGRLPALEDVPEQMRYDRMLVRFQSRIYQEIKHLMLPPPLSKRIVNGRKYNMVFLEHHLGAFQAAFEWSLTRSCGPSVGDTPETERKCTTVCI